jgi:thiol-disulfide isomerase/thioredoxin
MENEAMMQEKGADESTMMKKDDAVMKDTMTEEKAMQEKGSYEPYTASTLAKASGGDVVLFFRATWCPTCRALDADIKANQQNIPAGLTILDVNYDTETALKQKYGVTVQHTLVQVSADGTLIKKWQGNPTLTALVAQVL